MRIHHHLAVVAVLVPCVAGAQTTTADGVQAIIRGDYATAARILRPLAEESPQPDPLAQFFMAMLYEAGQGVPPSSFRACGLYKSAATPANPLMNQSLVLGAKIEETVWRLPPPFNEACSARELWHDPPTASFTLGQGHSVTIDQTGVTVAYNGIQKTANMEMGGPGFVFLPVRYTQIAVSRPAEARRHFIQFYFWMPYTLSAQPAWTLAWVVNEVVGPDVLPVTGDRSLTTVAGARPPMSFEVGNIARVRVNGSGEAEWVVFGANPRSGIIPYMGSR